MQGSQGGRERCDQWEFVLALVKPDRWFWISFTISDIKMRWILQGEVLTFSSLTQKQRYLPLGVHKSELRDLLIQVKQVSRKPGCDLSSRRYFRGGWALHLCLLLVRRQTQTLQQASGRVSTGPLLHLGRSVCVPDRVQGWVDLCVYVCVSFEKCELDLWRTWLFCCSSGC